MRTRTKTTALLRASSCEANLSPHLRWSDIGIVSSFSSSSRAPTRRCPFARCDVDADTNECGALLTQSSA